MPNPVISRRWAGLLVSVSLLAPALTLRAENRGWLSRDWQSDDGLPNNVVSGLAQTADGYLWLGTPTGLARFDGVRFEAFSSTNFVESSHRGILTMIRRRDGGLCLAMDRGAIVVLNGEKTRVFLPHRDLPDQVPYSLAEDANGALWIGYRDGIVSRIENGIVTTFGAAAGLPRTRVPCGLASDGGGRIWFGKAGQLGWFENGRFETLRRFTANTGISLATARDGGVWICAGSELLKYSDAEKFQSLGSFEVKRAGTIPTVLLESQAGTVWVGTSYDGLFHFNGVTFESVATTHQEIMSLAQDNEGNLWAGTGGGGLNRIRARSVALEGAEAGLPFEAVRSLCEDSEGNLWATTQNGLLVRRSAGRWTPFSPTPNWRGDATCVTADVSGTVWIGRRLRGFLCWRGDRLVEWGDTNQLRGQTVHSIHVSRAGDLWVGEDTPQAVQRLRNGQLTTLELPEADVRVLRAMTEDASGTIWVGTSRGMLLRVEGDRLVDETARTMGEPASIRCLYATPDGSVWIGYAGWGLGRLKDGRFTNIRTEQGLFDDFISQIVADGRGWLWFGANRGLFKVRQQELEEFAEGRVARVRSIHYGRGEGLPSLQANFGVSPGALRSRDGRLWIPMRTGLAVVNPDELPENSAPPAVLVHRVVVDERTAAWYSGALPSLKSARPEIVSLQSSGPQLRVPPAHRRLEFEVAAFSFTAPENVSFRWRLEGYDDHWIEAGTQRVATYSRLPAGSYQFRVTACNHAGVWNESSVAVAFVVAPFFWQTWWFRLGALASFTLCVVGLVRYVSFRRLRRQLLKLEQQEALHRERARIAKDIHDDVGANLTQIALLGELARQDRAAPDVAGPRIEKISVTARQAIKSLDEIVWAVNPRNDTLAHLIDYAGQFALDYLRVAGIRCRLDFPEDTPQHEISTDVRHNLFLIVKEALNNVVKHANAGTVWLRVNATDELLRVVIEDDGRGFAPAPVNSGADGLRNMRQRAADIGGRCEIRSEPDSGTTVTVEVPWQCREAS